MVDTDTFRAAVVVEDATLPVKACEPSTAMELERKVEDAPMT